MDQASRLRAVGLRVTRPRLAVLAALAEHPHADADTLCAAARAELGSLSTQAVYDILHAVTDHGIARRIEPAGHPARYELRVGDNHHHAVCRSCGFTADVDCVPGTAPCIEVQPGSGFAVDEAEVIFWGYCAECSATAAAM